MPLSFLPREDADSLTVQLKYTRPATWRDRLPSLGRNLGLAVGLMLLVGLFPNDDGAGPVWTLLTEGYDPASAFALVAVVLGVSILVVFAEFRRRVRAVAETTEWVFERAGLRLADGSRLPWHEVRAVVVDGQAVRLDRHDGSSVYGPVGRHPHEDRVALVHRLCAHAEAASLSEPRRRALDRAVRELTEGAS